MKESGCEGVPEWMLTLPKASKQQKRQLASRPIERRQIGHKARRKFKNPDPLPADRTGRWADLKEGGGGGGGGDVGDDDA
eukprot:SAG22_NODE_10048_length_556_cov_0.787746_1_plen_80_part_00